MKAKALKSKTIKVDYLARVEGEGGVFIKIKDDEVVDLKLNIFEPPRFFEAFLRGRDYSEVPDITARICGICPVAYQMSSSQAIENAFGLEIDEQTRNLRRLLYCGEWIESHALHIYLLHAPDFLGCHNAFQIAQKFPEVVKRGLKLKEIGNELMTIIGGREIHPVNVKVGGFYKIPTEQDLQSLVPKLEWALNASIETVRWVSKFSFPKFEQDYEFVSLCNPNEYPILDGRIKSNKGLDISIADFENFFIEEHVKHSNALHSILINKGNYCVGPVARYNLNYDRLSPKAKKVAKEINFEKVCLNPFKSIIVRSIELVYACEEALRIIQKYKQIDVDFLKVKPFNSIGYGCTEAPRGILYHSYRIDDNGTILSAKIIPPTSQNQKTIEKDLKDFVVKNIKLNPDKLQWQCEQMVRNYDPCISCATHCIKLEVLKG